LTHHFESRLRSDKQQCLFYADSLSSTPLRTFETTVAMATAELANAYAALILADDGVEITVRTSP
jgi:hypothetical protein